MDEKQTREFVDEVRILADEVDALIEVFRHEYRDETDPERPMLPRARKVYDIFEAAKVRAVNAAEGREVRSVPTIAKVAHDHAEKLFDDVIYSENPEGLIAEIEATHRALLSVGFKPDHQIVLKMNEAYRTAYESLQ